MILLVILIISILFLLLNCSKLTDHEVLELAEKRRMKKINNYFHFDPKEKIPDLDFKKRMKATGKFYSINEMLFLFPSIASALLKYKKHEWLIIAFEKNKMVDLIWVNKGADSTQVHFSLTEEQVLDIAKDGKYNSVLVFHNHPNSDPQHFHVRNPSIQDIQTTESYADVLNSNSVNLLGFICERGNPYLYSLFPATSFFPLKDFIHVISLTNGQSRLKNILLHMERIFTK